ncbi:MAG: hypothetical protein WC860_05060 [Candidatus Margulisiibacteriota bacterium]|jgi:hypothetical protein
MELYSIQNYLPTQTLRSTDTQSKPQNINDRITELIEKKEFTQSLALIERLKPGEDKDKLYRSVVLGLAEIPDFNLASELVGKIFNNSDFALAMGAISKAYLKVGKLSEAKKCLLARFDAVMNIEDPETKEEFLEHVITNLINFGKQTKDLACIEIALTAIELIKDDDLIKKTHKDFYQLDIVKAFTDIDNDRAHFILNKILRNLLSKKDFETQVSIQIFSSAASGQYHGNLRTQRDNFYSDLVTCVIRLGDFEKGQRIAYEELDNEHYYFLLTDLIKEFITNGKERKAVATFKEAANHRTTLENKMMLSRIYQDHKEFFDAHQIEPVAKRLFFQTSALKSIFDSHL